MEELETIKQEIQSLAEKAQDLVSTMTEASEMDAKRKNIQRGKLIAYRHAISIIDKKLNSKIK